MGQVEIGEIIDGKYRVDSILGQGGMGSVVAATHIIRRAPVALKFLLPEIANVPSIVDRFINEAVAASALDCDNVISIFDVGNREGAPYLVMEYLDGSDMEGALERCRNGQMDIARAVHIVLQALRGLTAAHNKGIVHRDLKPANLFLIKKDGDADFVKVLDFGVSKLTTPDRKALTSTGTGLGTPLYMSPEQARDAQSADARADVYSMGAVLYQALAGQVPLDGNTMAELITKLITEEPVRLEQLRPDIPPRLADIVHRALAKNPAQRYQSAYEFASDLSGFTDERSIGVVSKLRATAPALSLNSTRVARTLPDSAVRPMAATAQAFGGGTTANDTSATRSSKKSLLIGAAAAGALLIGAGVFAVTGGGQAEAPAPVVEETPTAPASAPPSAPELKAEPIRAVPEPSNVVPSAEPAQQDQPTAAPGPSIAPAVQVPPTPAPQPVVAKPKAKPAPRPSSQPATSQPAAAQPSSPPSTAPKARNPLEIGIK